MSEEKRTSARRSDEQPRRRTGSIAGYDGNDQAASSEPPERETEDAIQSSERGSSGSLDTLRPGASGITRSRQLQSPRASDMRISPLSQRRTGPRRPPTDEPTIQLTSRYSRTGAKPRKEALLPHLLKGRVHWLLPLGIGMIAMLILWEVGSVALAWGMNEYNNIVYGMPRTYQTDFVVGHGDSAAHPSHFIAVNLNHQAIVIEFPAGNPQNAKSYLVPYYILGSDSAEVPVTVEFRDVNGDGKPDMIVHIHLQAQDQTFVFINTGKQFRSPTSNDHIHL